MDGPETLTAHIPSDAEVGKQCKPPRAQGTGLFTGQHSDTRTTQAGAFPLVHLVKNQPRWPGAASSRPGCS